ncbi:heavy-metal-associated domain-containing protein [Noviherbaspirillum denitrificans]|uniref:HMA domain-containing protein n=1 Tax=Noviherbaspirillum denitrificans TaxID=1968433 RepID=A0A254TQ32_9BURK|nr:heavy-metal-associated domain-containing protein [Noviherbaspirillum denitrificans]OWW21838.1 hypothetical protein AYR66_22415 [Noviherbaspirillum denitrificans]
MIELQVEKMSCGGCAARVTRVVQSLDDSAKVKVDLPRKIVYVESDIDTDTLVQAITAAGYPARAQAGVLAGQEDLPGEQSGLV